MHLLRNISGSRFQDKHRVERYCERFVGQGYSPIISDILLLKGICAAFPQEMERCENKHSRPLNRKTPVYAEVSFCLKSYIDSPTSRAMSFQGDFTVLGCRRLYGPLILGKKGEIGLKAPLLQRGLRGAF